MAGRMPWSKHPGTHTDSDVAGSGPARRRRECPAGLGAPAGHHSWPVHPAPADVANARRLLAEYPDRFPKALPPPPYPHPAIAVLPQLAIDMHNAAAVLDAALRVDEDQNQDDAT